jgi:hypothetical protein
MRTVLNITMHKGEALETIDQPEVKTQQIKLIGE